MRQSEIWCSTVLTLLPSIFIFSCTLLSFAHFLSLPLVMNQWVVPLLQIGLNPKFLSAYLARTKPRKGRGGEEEEEEGWWRKEQPQTKGWFRTAVHVSFIRGPLSHAWSWVSCYIFVLLDAWNRMRRFVPALLLETKLFPLTDTHTHTHKHSLHTHSLI